LAFQAVEGVLRVKRHAGFAPPHRGSGEVDALFGSALGQGKLHLAESLLQRS
jgi:hypothetical protein